MNSEISRTDSASLASFVAPEDLQCDDFVTVLTEIVEVPSFFWCDSFAAKEEQVRLRCIPSGSGLPWKVKAICLPFIFAKSPLGQSETLDVRRMQLARLQADYARKVWKELKRSGSNSRRELRCRV